MALGRVRIGVDEDVHVVEGADQLDVLGQHHPVAEHVARHVADADHGEVLVLNIGAHFTEVALDRFPGPLGGDAHAFMVVALRPAGRKGVAQPMTVFQRHPIGDVRKRRRALVRGNHQIGIVVIPAIDAFGRHDAGALQVVGHVQQTRDQGFVAGDAFGHEGVAPAIGGRAFDDEPALRADRHDDRVLDLLRFDQAQDLGAEIFRPVGPAQAPAGDEAKAQMHAFDPWAVDEDFPQRTRLRQIVDLP